MIIAVKRIITNWLKERFKIVAKSTKGENMFKTPQEVFEQSKKYLEAFPTSVEDAKEVAEKVKRVVEAETANAKDVISTFNKASRGDASINEIMAANRKVQDLAVAARFAAFAALPGAIFLMPFAIEAAREYDVDFLPKSVEKEFNI
jgi:predicted nuclease with RNAse H fold